MTLKQEACIMSFTKIHVFVLFVRFFCRDKKGLLNFVSERILLVYGINLLGTALKKSCLSNF